MKKCNKIIASLLPSDYEVVANVVNSCKLDAILEVMNSPVAERVESSFGLHDVFETAGGAGFGVYSASDNIMSAKMAERMKAEYINQSARILPEKLLLFLAAVTKGFLEETSKVKKGFYSGPDSAGISELTYGNGDIVSAEGTKIYLSRNGNRGFIEEEFQEFEDKMVEAILIANSRINSLNKNINLSVSGEYKQTGTAKKTKKISLTAKDLQAYAQSSTLIQRLSFSKMKELLNNRTLSKSIVFRLMANGELDKNIAIRLMSEGALDQKEVLERVFKVQRISDLPLNKDVSYESKLLLYSLGSINIELLEKSVRQYQEENIDITEGLKKISKYYSGDIKKISELLTHNVLDYNNSQRLLTILQEDGRISVEDRTYLDSIMADFKVRELLNDTQNEIVSIGNDTGTKYDGTKAGLTISPEERLRYLTSLGAVKKVKIRGESFIRDSDSNIGKKNSLDGYELFVIPEKRVAILEKLYETTRDKNGQIIYRKTKEGNLVPAISNATYVIPIEMALEFSKKKNKKELIESPDVRRVNHTMEWVSNLEAKIKNLMALRGRTVEFDRQNTEKWTERIRKNYFANRQRREDEVK